MDCNPNKKIGLVTPQDPCPIREHLHLMLYRHNQAFTKEIYEMARKDRVLKQEHGGSKWTSPIFIVPKKDKNEIRIMSIFRKINSFVEGINYPPVVYFLLSFFLSYSLNFLGHPVVLVFANI